MTSVQKDSYKSFVKDNCTRDRTVISNCFLAEFKQEITSLSVQLTNLNRLLLKDGKYEDFNSALFERLLPYLEKQSEEMLLNSDIGMNYFSQYGSIIIKQLTFCGFCLKLGIEVVQEQLSHNNAKLIYSAILNYYLAGKSLNCEKISKLQKIVEQKTGKEIIFKANQNEVFQKEFPEISSQDEERLKMIKDYLQDPNVKDIINGFSEEPAVIPNEDMNSIIIDRLPHQINTANDLIKVMKSLSKLSPKQSKQMKADLEKNLSGCKECLLTPSECLEKRRRARDVLKKSDKEIMDIWLLEKELHSCLKLALIELLSN